MSHNITRRRSIRAEQLREGCLVDFDDGNPAVVSDVKCLPHSVLFTARGAQFRLERDDEVVLVIRMQLVGE